MPQVTTRDGTETFYKDWGSGQALVFHHGWPLSADDCDTQMLFFLGRGYRVIAHDRRGHGRSSQTAGGHEMNGTLKTYPGLPHGVATTHPDVINADLLAFVRGEQVIGAVEQRSHVDA
jgi:pimeloyl-ACP methyl ester carboxylesterase